MLNPAATRPLPLHLDDVSRILGRTRVVDHVSLTLAPGEITALLGGSGAGKSTLLRLIAGLEPVDSGSIRHGSEVWSRKGQTVPPEARRTGLIFQDFALFPHLNAAENVRFGLTTRDRNAARDAAHHWLDRLGLAGRATAYPHELSGGEQQRVAIARALAPEPRAVLMDEPFSGLDPGLRDGVRELTLSLLREAGVPAVLVTHDPVEAMAHADRLGVMHGGRLIQIDTPEAVWRHPVSRESAGALGPVSVIAGLRAGDGVVDSALGRLPAPGIAAGEACMVVLREGALGVAPKGGLAFTVRRVAFAGTHWLLNGEIGGLSLGVQAGMDPAPPKLGETVSVKLKPDMAFVFAAEG
jgi:iron(III) transport system ATP-binding protein